MALETTLEPVVEDDRVTFILQVTNAGPAAVELTFRSGQRADVVVYEDAADRELVWRWSDGRMFTQAITSETLATGDAIEETLTWEDPRPGSYTAIGTLEADIDADARASFEV